MHGFEPSEQMLHKYECRVDLRGPKKWGVLYLSNNYVCYQCDTADPPLSWVVEYQRVAECVTVREGLVADLVLAMSNQEKVRFYFHPASMQKHGATHAHATITSKIGNISGLRRMVATASDPSNDSSDSSTETYELAFLTAQGYLFPANATIELKLVGSLKTYVVPDFSSADVRVRDGLYKYRFQAPCLGYLRHVTVQHRPNSWNAVTAENIWVLQQVTLMEESTTRQFTFQFTKHRPLHPSDAQTVGPPVEGPEGVVIGRIIEECFENEVLHPRTTGRMLARERWTSSNGTPRLKDSFELPDSTWMWDDDWQVEAGMDDLGRSLTDGWSYALTWDGTWAAEKGRIDQVRRRRWIRVRRKRV
jgi:hypothetical protein